MSMRKIKLGLYCLVALAGSGVALAGNCDCGTSCKSNCNADQNGCCGCGSLSSSCICCPTTQTCKSGSTLGVGYASCKKAS